MTKISIIVPMYNVSEYLHRSLESLINQTFEDIEIILVNDGSTDNTLDIANQYQEKDNRIKIINKKNGGVSSARNVGLEIAKGEYIGFVDPDDWIEKNMYESLYSSIHQEKYDVVLCNFYRHKYTNKPQKNTIPTKKNELTKEEINKWLIPNMISPKNLNSGENAIMGSVCRLLVKKDKIRQLNLKFDQDISIMEDLLWIVELFVNSDKVSIDHGYYYHYMANEESAMQGYRKNTKELRDIVSEKLLNLLIKYNIDSHSKERFKMRYIDTILFSIANEVKQGNEKKFVDKIITIKKWTQDAVLKENLDNLEIKSYKLKKKLVFLGLKKEKALFLYLYYKLFTITEQLKKII